MVLPTNSFESEEQRIVDVEKRRKEEDINMAMRVVNDTALYESRKQYYKCTFPRHKKPCGRIDTFPDLQIHMGKEHFDIIRYRCEMCSRKFHMQVELLNKGVHDCRDNPYGKFVEVVEFRPSPECKFHKCQKVYIVPLSDEERQAHLNALRARRANPLASNTTPAYDESDEPPVKKSCYAEVDGAFVRKTPSPFNRVQGGSAGPSSSGASSSMPAFHPRPAENPYQAQRGSSRPSSSSASTWMHASHLQQPQNPYGHPDPRSQMPTAATEQAPTRLQRPASRNSSWMPDVSGHQQQQYGTQRPSSRNSSWMPDVSGHQQQPYGQNAGSQMLTTTHQVFPQGTGGPPPPLSPPPPPPTQAMSGTRKPKTEPGLEEATSGYRPQDHRTASLIRPRPRGSRTPNDEPERREQPPGLTRPAPSGSRTPNRDATRQGSRTPGRHEDPPRHRQSHSRSHTPSQDSGYQRAPSGSQRRNFSRDRTPEVNPRRYEAPAGPQGYQSYSQVVPPAAYAHPANMSASHSAQARTRPAPSAQHNYPPTPNTSAQPSQTPLTFTNQGYKRPSRTPDPTPSSPLPPRVTRRGTSTVQDPSRERGRSREPMPNQRDDFRRGSREHGSDVASTSAAPPSANTRQSRSMTTNAQRTTRSTSKVPEGETGTMTLKPTKPVQGRNRSQVRYQTPSRNKSPMAVAEKKDIDEIQEKKTKFNITSRSTAKTPNNSNRAAALLMDPVPEQKKETIAERERKKEEARKKRLAAMRAVKEAEEGVASSARSSKETTTDRYEQRHGSRGGPKGRTYEDKGKRKDRSSKDRSRSRDRRH